MDKETKNFVQILPAVWTARKGNRKEEVVERKLWSAENIKKTMKWGR